MQERTTEVRFMTSVNSRSGDTRSTEHMRINWNAQGRMSCLGNDLPNVTLSHRFPVHREPQRRTRFFAAGKNRPVRFQVFVDQVTKIVLNRTLIRSFLLGLCGGKDDPPNFVDFDDAAANRESRVVF
jgi:hypothetical protein